MFKSEVPKELKKRKTKVNAKTILKMATHAASHLENLRKELLAPYPRKAPPVFKSSQLAGLLGPGWDRKRIDRLLAAQEDALAEGKAPKTNLPTGDRDDNRKQRQFSLTDVYEWVHTYNPPKRTSPLGKTVVFGNYKGGVAKSTSSVAMAQALTLKGLRVLFIDLDPQGTATLCLGFDPDVEINESNTILPILYNHKDPEYQDCLKSAVQKTYWPNLDIIASSSQLAEAEMLIIGQLKSNPSIEFWNILHEALRNVRAEYDVIVIDTPPQLSNITLNAIFAADGLIMPLPPAAVDFASSTAFWWLVGEIVSGIDKAASKEFDFVNVLLTKVDMTKTLTPEIVTWVRDAYGDTVLPFYIPESTAVSNASAEFGTIYDTPTPLGSLEAYRKVRDPHDKLADYIYTEFITA